MIRWWLQEDRWVSVVPLQVPPPSLPLHTDASVGFGAPTSGPNGCRSVVPRGELSPYKHLEMKAIVLALAAFLPQLLGQCLVVMSDNATVVTYLRNQGGTVSRVVCHMAAEVVLWTERHSVSLLARYIPGRKNVLVDQLSRLN